jgi:hypothetical protein
VIFRGRSDGGVQTECGLRAFEIYSESSRGGVIGISLYSILGVVQFGPSAVVPVVKSSRTRGDDLESR